MLSLILIAGVLVAVTVAVHAAGISEMLRILRRSNTFALTGFWPSTRLLILLVWGLLLCHLVEIGVWGLFYLWWGFLPDAETALYFSGVTYASIGYGDLVLAKPWRLLAPVEGLTGILMCGLSAGLFFAVVNQIYGSRHGHGPRT